MQYRKFGKLDFMASALGFGCMRLPTLSEEDKDLDWDESIKMIRYAIDHGVNYLDSALFYHGGNSELLLAKVLKDGYRDKVKIATKLPTWLFKEEADFDMYLNKQLKNLDVDYIDFYMMHSIDRYRWDRMLKNGAYKAFDRYKKSGRAPHIGVSFHDDLKTFKKVIDDYDWDLCQIQLNYMDEQFQAGIEGLHYAASKGIPVVIMEPLRGGALSKEPPADVKKVIDSYPVKRSPADWGLSWVLNHPEVTVVLSGMSTMDQLKENLKTADRVLPNSLTEEELKIINKVKEIYKSRSKVGCTNCRYCMPCPFLVDVPRNLTLLNDIYMYDALKEKQATYRTINHNYRASNCRDCGKCEKDCPQSLPIRELLKVAAEMLES